MRKGASELHAVKRLEYFRVWASAIFLQIIDMLQLGQSADARNCFHSSATLMDSHLAYDLIRLTAFPTVVVGSKFLREGQGETAAICFERAIHVLNCKKDRHQTEGSRAFDGQEKHVLGLAHTMLGDICRTKALKDQYDLQKAEHYYRTAIELDDSLDDAYSGLATMLKDRGKLLEALGHYRTALCKSRLMANAGAPANRNKPQNHIQGELFIAEESPKTFLATHTFNLAQCLEYLGLYPEAISLLDTYVENASLFRVGKVFEIEDWAILLLLSKLLYVGGKGHIMYMRRVPLLLEKIVDIPEDVQSRIKVTLKTHWAYSYYLRQLLTRSKVLAKTLNEKSSV